MELLLEEMGAIGAEGAVGARGAVGGIGMLESGSDDERTVDGTVEEVVFGC
jgi:hypothetical protein